MKVMCTSNDDTMPLSLLTFCGVGPVASFHTSSDAYRDCFHRDCFHRDCFHRDCFHRDCFHGDCFHRYCFHRDCLFFHDYFLIGSVIIVVH